MDMAPCSGPARGDATRSNSHASRRAVAATLPPGRTWWLQALGHAILIIPRRNMNLDQTVASISDLDDDAIICVTRPWSATAACVVVAPDENLAVPQAVKNAGFEYFLEVYIAK